MKMLFDLGALVATPGAIALLGRYREPIPNLVTRHASGDWGDLDDHDTKMNNEAVSLGNRILSSYPFPDGEKVWVITESDRSVTTVLLPSEY
jgi:hypothetical protein